MASEEILSGLPGLRLGLEHRRLFERLVSDVQRVEGRAVLARAGRPATHVHLLLDGLVARHVDDRHGLRQIVGLRTPGDFLDLDAVHLSVTDHDLATMTPARVARAPLAALRALLADRPDFAQALWLSTLRDAAMTRTWVFRLGRLDAVGRVAHFLCEIDARLSFAGLSDGRRFALDLTQFDLAEICGLTNVHVNRVMRQLREERLCVFRSGTVEMLQPALLAARGQFTPAHLHLDHPAEPAALPRARSAG
jgi:CRP-like cAMP-binding protein